MKVYNTVSVRHLEHFAPKKSNINVPQKRFKSVYERLGVNMETQVGYAGEMSIKPIPETVKPSTAKFLESLGVNWKTHVSK